MTSRPLSALVVATGDGAPMRSARPKPIHMLCGRPMASYVLRALGNAGVNQAAVVTSPDGGRVSKRLLDDGPSFPLRFVEHRSGLGTAEAALAGMSALDIFEDESDLLVVPADLPLLQARTVEQLVNRHWSTGAACTVLAAMSDVADPLARRHDSAAGLGVGTGPQPAGAGPVVRRDRRDRVEGIVSRQEAERQVAQRQEDEAESIDGWARGMPSVGRAPDTVRLSRGGRDQIRRALGATPVQEPVTVFEISLGVFCIRSGLIAPALRRLTSMQTPGRRHGHDPFVEQSMSTGHHDHHHDGVAFDEVVAVLASSGHMCETAVMSDASDLVPVDNRLQMADAEAELRRRTNRHWLRRGVSMVDPDRTYLDATVELGVDVTLFPGTILQGRTVISDGCEIGPDVHLNGCRVGEGSSVAKTTAERSTIGRDCVVGPFAALAPGSQIDDGTATGPFYAGT